MVSALLSPPRAELWGGQRLWHTHIHTFSPPQASRCWLLNKGHKTSARCSHHPAAAACNNKETCQKVQQTGLKHHQHIKPGPAGGKPAVIYPNPETCTIPIPKGKKGNLHNLGRSFLQAHALHNKFRCYFFQLNAHLCSWANLSIRQQEANAAGAVRELHL